MRLTTFLSFLTVVLLLVSSTLKADSDEWLLGKWHLVYDPDGGKTDFLDFQANGDVISSGLLGDVTGIYTVTPDSVKAVLTYKEKDVILTFFYNPLKTQLRIVTSSTGQESIYEKVAGPEDNTITE